MKIVFDWDSWYLSEYRPLTGESLWIHQLVRLLASRGHEVYLLQQEGSRRNWEELPLKVQWFSSTRLKELSDVDVVVRYLTRRSDRSPEYRERWEYLEAGKGRVGRILSLHFYPKSLDMGRSAPNEIICIPSWQFYFSTKQVGWETKRKHPKCQELPIPIGEWKPSRFSNRGVVWTGKHGWSDRPFDQLEPSLNRWMWALNSVAERYPTAVLQGPSRAPTWGSRYLQNGMPAVPEWWLSQSPSMYRQSLSRFSIAYPVNLGGSLMDLVPMGLVPLLYAGGGNHHIPHEVLVRLNGTTSWKDVSATEILERTELLMNSEKEFNRQLTLLRDALDQNRDERVYQCFLQLVS